jgi:hypothetical protein
MSQATKPPVPELAELATLFPQPRIIEAGGIKISIPVLNFGQLAKVTTVVGPILAKTPADQPIAQTLVDNVDALKEVLAVAIGWPIDRLEALPADIVVQITLELLEVNVDFLRSRLLPQAAGFAKIGAQLGSMSSPSSSSTGTTTLNS